MKLIPTPNTTVAEIATQIPGAAGLFESLGIDYCCGGKLPLESACRRKNLSPTDLLERLASLPGTLAEGDQDWSAATMTELANHIESTHHRYLKQELPRLVALSAKVASVHGDNHPELVTLAKSFAAFAADMKSHMDKEEGVLFPLLRAAEQQVSTGVRVDRPIACMTDEHEEAGRALEQFRALTNGFVPPMAACNSWRVLLGDLARLEHDMHQHVHKENNILFPMALATTAA